MAKEYEKNLSTVPLAYYCLMHVAGEAIQHQKDKTFATGVLDYLEYVALSLFSFFFIEVYFLLDAKRIS